MKINPYHFKHFMACVACTIALSACHTLKQTTQDQPQFSFSPDWSQRQQDLEASTEWQTLGKLGVKTAQDGGSATLTWHQSPSGIHLDMVGPLGQGRISITSIAGEFTMIEAGKPPVSAASAEALLLKSTGWRVPVAELGFWIRALPDPGHPVESITANALGQLSEMKQLGWQITYSDYVSVPSRGGKTLLLPGRIIAQFNQAPSIKLTLVAREWKFGAQP